MGGVFKAARSKRLTKREGELWP